MYYCPRCKARLHKGEFGWNCHNCLLSVPFLYRDYRLPKLELQKLLKEGSTSLIYHWKRTDGKGEIAGWLQFQPDYSLIFKAKEMPSVSCPTCGNSIHENKNCYFCGSCDLTLWKIVAKRPLSEMEVRSLFQYGQTEKLDKFVSKETGKFFSARLKLGDNGDVSFLFE